MKKIAILAVALVAIFTSCNGGGFKSSTPEVDSVSRALGTIMAYNAKQLKGVEVNTAAFAEAFQQAYSKEDIKAEVETADEYLRNYIMTILPGKLKEANDKYMADLAKNSKIQKTESGLMYEVIEAGDNTAMPLAIDTVIVNYKGTLTDGSTFDSSYDRGEPATFPLNGVIQGWTEGIQLVGKGGKIKLYIPSELAYGSQGQLANQVLIFDVELLDVKKGAEVK